jgi:hypothetical protein
LVEQVPWGKHTPPGDPEYRRMHKTKKDAGTYFVSEEFDAFE